MQTSAAKGFFITRPTAPGEGGTSGALKGDSDGVRFSFRATNGEVIKLSQELLFVIFICTLPNKKAQFAYSEIILVIAIQLLDLFTLSDPNREEFSPALNRRRINSQGHPQPMGLYCDL